MEACWVQVWLSCHGAVTPSQEDYLARHDQRGHGGAEWGAAILFCITAFVAATVTILHGLNVLTELRRPCSTLIAIAQQSDGNQMAIRWRSDGNQMAAQALARR